MSSAPSDSDVLIKVDNVSKKFCRDFKKSLWYGVKDTAADILHPRRAHNSPPSVLRSQTSASDSHPTSDLRPPTSVALPSLRPSEFWANQNISFEVKRGECLGLIGHNGAGKTTLLKMLNGLIKPDTGSITMKGRIGALIALGAGFNPILTGRENIYVNGSILGLSRKEITTKLDEIIDFAEIEDAIDAPVRTYSSGMQVRLGFAVATTMEPNILILDEVLAVGDFSFRMKCLDRISKMLPKCAVIFVSHNLDQVRRICDQAIHMESGRMAFNGSIGEAALHYENRRNSFAEPEKFYTHGISEVTTSLPQQSRLPFGNDLSFRVRISFADFNEKLACRILFTDSEGKFAAEWQSTAHAKVYTAKAQATIDFTVNIRDVRLRTGTYSITILVGDTSNKQYFAQIKNISKVLIEGAPSMLGNYQL